MNNAAKKNDSEPSKTVAEEELEDENSVKDGSYLGKSYGLNDQNDVSGEPLISESVRETITEAGKSIKPTSRVGLANDFNENVFGAREPAQRDLGGESLPLGTIGTIGAGRTPAAGGITPLKATQQAGTDLPKADRPPSAASKYSAVVFSQPKIPAEPAKEKSNDSDDDGDDYEDDFEDDFEPYETSNEEEAQAENNTTPNNAPPP